MVLTHLTTFMPKLHATSGGRYGAFLFAIYEVVLTIAEAVTLKVRLGSPARGGHVLDMARSASYTKGDG